MSAQRMALVFISSLWATIVHADEAPTLADEVRTRAAAMVHAIREKQPGAPIHWARFDSDQTIVVSVVAGRASVWLYEAPGTPAHDGKCRDGSGMSPFGQVCLPRAFLDRTYSHGCQKVRPGTWVWHGDMTAARNLGRKPSGPRIGCQTRKP